MKYIGSPAYLNDISNLKPQDKPALLRDLDSALDSEYKQRERLALAQRRVPEANIEVQTARGKLVMAQSQGYPNEVADAQKALERAEEEADRREQMVVTERKLLQDKQADSEIARTRAKVLEQDVSEGRRLNREAISLLAEGSRLEKRRQELIKDINNDIQYSGYSPAQRQNVVKPLSFDRCWLVNETGLFENLPYEIGEVIPESQRERLYNP